MPPRASGLTITNLKRDLGLRFTLLLSTFLVILIASYVVSTSAISSKKYDSVLLNIAGKQRMLIHRYTSEINQVLVGLAAADFDMVLAEKNKADETTKQFERIHNTFINGGNLEITSISESTPNNGLGNRETEQTLFIPPITNMEIIEQLDKVDAQWQELKRITLLSLRSNIQSVSKSPYVRQLLDQASNTANEMDLAVLLMQQSSEEKLQKLESILLTMTIAGSILFLAILYFVYTKIVLPLDSSVKGLHDSTITLEAEKQRAEKASQAKSEFLSSMSHELRTPMNAILGFAQLLKLDPALNTQQQENTTEILKAGNHLLALINEVLDLAKIESGHIDLSLEPVKVSTLVDECFLLVTPVANSLGISINHDDMGDYFVHADRTRLKQIIINLLSNAIKYNRANGSVSLKTQQTNNDTLRITISDTGPGIPKNRLDALFEPFNRLDAEQSAIEGTGIGLTITKKLVEKMHGHIGVDSEPGSGSHFWIELPLTTAGHDAAHSETAITHCIPPTAEADQKHTILYIEDNPANLRLVCQILSGRNDISIVTAHDPVLGIDLAGVHLPKLILLDINMPHMNGYQVLKVIQSNDRLRHIPVIAMTAKAMAGDIKKGMSAGFSAYLTKPLDIPHFLATIDQYLD